ncbi:uncharacterized protein LOC106674121 isoform X1 [Cimex lectularius]|uniref:Uncharacterized protein n=1 Tax=Cimex lectularius TaxID=79782 RepID=A0A8I6TKP5_CIMLE|nr:uncharacterized protein LOC106674121 isoform X1 [Cimex lectularius]
MIVAITTALSREEIRGLVKTPDIICTNVKWKFFIFALVAVLAVGAKSERVNFCDFAIRLKNYGFKRNDVKTCTFFFSFFKLSPCFICYSVTILLLSNFQHGISQWVCIAEQQSGLEPTKRYNSIMGFTPKFYGIFQISENFCGHNT